MKFIAICHTCSKQHLIDFDPVIGSGAAFSDWLTKHPDHNIDFVWKERTQKASQPDNQSWEAYLHNADVKVAYGTLQNVTITLASLAASSSLLGGREATAISNTTNLYLDYLLEGRYRTAATNLQAGKIRTAVFGAMDDSPTYPDSLTGSDATATITAQIIYDSAFRIASEIVTDTTQRYYPFGPVGLAGFFGGVMPNNFSFFVSQSAQTSTNVWSATAGDFLFNLKPVYATAT